MFKSTKAKSDGDGNKEGDLGYEPNLMRLFMDYIGLFVRRDEPTKKIIFCTGLSAYTRNPINLFLKGPSSIGKTYTTTNVLKLFDEKDVWMLGGLSPTALVHGHGVLETEDGEEIKPIDWNRATREQKEEYRRKMENSRYVIEMRNKILVFLDAPYVETYDRLRPILSHDKWEISYKFTDKSGKGRLRTTHVVIRGWPATIFCTTQTKYIEDLSTRGFTVTPEMSTQKYMEANYAGGEMMALPWRFERDEELKELKGYVNKIVDKLKNYDVEVVIPYARELALCYPNTKPRDMRDFKHFSAVIKMFAILNMFQRPVLETKRTLGKISVENKYYVLASVQDAYRAFQLFMHFAETTRHGVPGHILDFFYRVLVVLDEDENVGDIRYEDVVEKYPEVYGETKSSKNFYQYTSVLADVGWVDLLPDPLDKRKKIIKVLYQPKNLLSSSIRRFPILFGEKEFKKWLSEVKSYSSQKVALLYNSLGEAEEPPLKSEEIDKHEINKITDEQMHDLYEMHFSEEYFPGQKKEEEEPFSKKKATKIPLEQNGRISDFSDRIGVCSLCRKMIHNGDNYVLDPDGRPRHVVCPSDIDKLAEKRGVKPFDRSNQPKARKHTQVRVASIGR